MNNGWWLSFPSLIVFGVWMFSRVRCRRAEQTSWQRYQALEEKYQALQHAALMREQFLATVSHQLRTPMNAILGFNNLLLTRVTDNPQAQDMLAHTCQSADHLLTVINDLLNDTPGHAGKIQVQAETFALRDTVNTAFQLFAPRLENTSVHYTCHIDEKVPHWVSTDRHRLMQILVNLLGNALKFTHQGQVSLRVSQGPEGVHFSVADSGIGISKEQQSKIFQRFAQAHEAIQTRYGGNGLGLSITQHLVKLLGGHLAFQSTEGVGSTFEFTLPLVNMPRPELPPPPEPNPIEILSIPPRFLVVDDHPINRLLLQQILKSRWKNCVIVEAHDGTQALECLNAKHFDVVLMDMVMPEMDGIDATTALRASANPKTRDTPVLGLTANVNPLDLERFTASGIQAVVLKPFEARQVCAQVAQLLTEKKSSLGS